jgi:hypothetical protein
MASTKPTNRGIRKTEKVVINERGIIELYARGGTYYTQVLATSIISLPLRKIYEGPSGVRSRGVRFVRHPQSASGPATVHVHFSNDHLWVVPWNNFRAAVKRAGTF